MSAQEGARSSPPCSPGRRRRKLTHRETRAEEIGRGSARGLQGKEEMWQKAQAPVPTAPGITPRGVPAVAALATPRRDEVQSWCLPYHDPETSAWSDGWAKLGAAWSPSCLQLKDEARAAAKPTRAERRARLLACRALLWERPLAVNTRGGGHDVPTQKPLSPVALSGSRAALEREPRREFPGLQKPQGAMQERAPPAPRKNLKLPDVPSRTCQSQVGGTQLCGSAENWAQSQYRRGSDPSACAKAHGTVG